MSLVFGSLNKKGKNRTLTNYQKLKKKKKFLDIHRTKLKLANRSLLGMLIVNVGHTLDVYSASMLMIYLFSALFTTVKFSCLLLHDI